MDDQSMHNEKELGNTCQVTFPQFRNANPVEAKVDTGATTSSLHAEQIQTSGGKVRFVCPELSSNAIVVPLEGSQEVHSADAGGKTRPIVKFDVTIDGVSLRGMTFNLNDRSGMDSTILIGQNILKAGKFTVNPSKDQHDDSAQPEVDQQGSMTRENEIKKAIDVLTENNISLAEILKYLKTEAVQNLEY